jgi:hypothetical protein
LFFRHFILARLALLTRQRDQYEYSSSRYTLLHRSHRSHRSKPNQCYSCRGVSIRKWKLDTTKQHTETIAVKSTGSALVNFETTSVIAQEFLTATKDDRSENASATIYEITRHDVNSRTEKGIVTAIFETNSTGQLAFLDGMIGVGGADVDEAGNTKQAVPCSSSSSSRRLSF